MVKLIKSVALVGLFVLSGCTNNNSLDSLDNDQKEFILMKVNNQKGLIDLYRENLREHEDEETRYKLAARYYDVEDYESSFRYLKPLLENSNDENVLILAARDNLETANYDGALEYIDKLLALNVKNGDAWNLRGVLFAQKREFDKAYSAYEKARELFVDDQIVVNNIAMCNIMQGDFPAARDNLLNLYRTGNSNQKINHNLVYVLVKLQDFDAAESVLQQMSNNEQTDEIIESLSSVEPNSAGPVAESVADEEPSNFIKHSKTVQPIPLIQTGKKLALPKSSFLQASKPAIESIKKSVPQSVNKAKKISFNIQNANAEELQFALASRYEINYRVLPDDDKHLFNLELYNCHLDSNLLAKINNLSGKNGVLESTASQSDRGSILITLHFESENVNAQVARVTSGKDMPDQIKFSIKHPV